jgi:hypothetical protein
MLKSGATSWLQFAGCLNIVLGTECGKGASLSSNCNTQRSDPLCSAMHRVDRIHSHQLDFRGSTCRCSLGCLRGLMQILCFDSQTEKDSSRFDSIPLHLPTNNKGTPIWQQRAAKSTPRGSAATPDISVIMEYILLYRRLHRKSS